MSDKTFFEKLSDDTKKLLKDVADKLKAHKIEMAEVAPAAPTELAATNDGVLADGTAIKYTGDTVIAVGADVTIVSADGEMPAPDGDLTMADGTVVTIASGKVTVVTPAPPAEMAADVKQVSERVTKIVEKFEAVEKENKALRIELENLKLKVGKQGALIADNSEVLLKFADIETAEVIEEPTVKKNKKDLSFSFKK